MASLSKTYTAEKLNGQFYTPSYIVQKILDDIGYNTSAILGKPILDPACGDGRFLSEIVKRIIQFSPKETLKQNLECVHGWDIDGIAVTQCIENLKQFVKIPVDWNITVADALWKYSKNILFSDKKETFDYIVGNPPYIRIQHLESAQRQYIQQNYQFCKSGSTDIYIAFYELCLHLLNEHGICGLITPNTFLSTETARPLRLHFADRQNIRQLTNYGNVQLFDHAATYSAIMIFGTQPYKYFLYQKATDKQTLENRIVAFSELQEPFWQLSADVAPKITGKKLKDVCKIHVGITTLCDAAYIFSIKPLDEHYVIAETKLRGHVKIEKKILKPIIKGSKLKHSEQPISEYVLFPYEKVNGKHTIIAENVLQEQYPLAYNYLLSVKTELDKRDNGRANPVAWYAFGRSQGLDTSFGKKIIFSPMNQKPNFVYYAYPECTFYSGYCIKFDGDAETLLAQLNSERMQEFVTMSSRDFRDGWKAYNKKIIEQFKVKV